MFIAIVCRLGNSPAQSILPLVSAWGLDNSQNSSPRTRPLKEDFPYAID
jgi:hypothetical protein